MSKSIRFASAVSFAALASIAAGCAGPQKPVVSSTGFGGQANGEIGLAMRALAALQSNDPATAIGFAERAVERTPDDAGFRTLLGNAYFAAGRFASAEAAYKDALFIYDNQPQTVLKLALADIAQGKNAEAMTVLDAGRAVLDPANYGLALALAGHPADAVGVLETAARVPNADGRVRQNLALAYALTGDWTKARIVAAQDVSADKLDARMQQWIQLAKPGRVSDQVASLTGVKPAARDPGQPVRLALAKPEIRQAEAAPVPQPQVAEIVPAPIAAEPQVEVAYAAPPPPPPPYNPARVAADPVEPAPIAAVAAAAAMAPEAPAAFAAFAPKFTSAPAKPRRAAARPQRPAVRAAALRSGGSSTVVQLGSYRSPQYVAAAWNQLSQRYPALRAYLPLRARFDSPKGTFWRLSIQGFGSQREAVARCQLLKNHGGNCFVRNFAGDAPVQIASR